MNKPVKTKIKLQCPAGKANPAPPVGTALGPHGLNIMEFCNSFNEKTKEAGDVILPVEITVYEDRSFDFIIKQPPAAELIKKALGVEKASGVPNREKVGKLTRKQVKKIAETKMPDLSARTLPEAEKIIAGTAHSMGVEVES
ncbi:MAG: 50S ribosomal protein L11 [bacterium]